MSPLSPTSALDWPWFCGASRLSSIWRCRKCTWESYLGFLAMIQKCRFHWRFFCVFSRAEWGRSGSSNAFCFSIQMFASRPKIMQFIKAGCLRERHGCRRRVWDTLMRNVPPTPHNQELTLKGKQADTLPAQPVTKQASLKIMAVKIIFNVEF